MKDFHNFKMLKIALATFAFFTAPYLTAVGKSGRVDSVFIAKLEQKFLSRFFPPLGDWAFSDGAVEAVLLKSGRVVRLRVIQHLLHKGKPSLYGDSALCKAISSSSPVDPPPNSITGPVKMTVKFFVKNKEHGGYGCVVKIED